MTSLMPQTLSWFSKQIFMSNTPSLQSSSASINKKGKFDFSTKCSPAKRCLSNSSCENVLSDNESEQHSIGYENRCPICFRKWCKPVQVPCQQDPAVSPHVFCKHCLEKWFEESRTCPTCRHTVSNNFTPIVLSSEQIERLLSQRSPMPCPNRDKGCQVTADDLDSLNIHVSGQCQFQSVRCQFAGCSLKLERSQLHSHYEECVHAKAAYWSSWLPTVRVDPPMNNNNNNNINNINNNTNARPKMLKRKWLNDAESHVADLVILPDNTTAVICFHGQILNLANNPSQSAVVLWRSRVHIQKSCNRRRTQFCHAAYDYITNRIYFTGCPVQDGIFWANLDDIKTAASLLPDTRNVSSVELRPLVATTRPQKKQHQREFWGITAIPQLQVIACCHRKPNSVGFWSATVHDGNNGSGCLLSEILFNFDLVTSSPFSPFRCAAFVSMTSPGADDDQRWHITLAVDDITNSRLHLLGLVAHQKKGDGDQAQNRRLRFEQKFEQILAWLGAQKGAVKSPDGLHFDPDGKLIVADSGNRRLQIFAATGGIQTFREQNPPSRLTTRRRSNSDLDKWRCVWSSSNSKISLGGYDPDLPDWCSMKVNAVVAPLDPNTKRPFILAALWDDEDVICYK